MPISHHYKIIFIHIPKCAGISVWKALNLNESTEYLISREVPVLQHLLPAELRGKYIPEDTWNTYKKFTIIRNPYDRIISDYFWLRNKKRFVQPKSFDEFLSLAENVVRKHSFEDNVYFDHFYPLHYYFNDIVYDHVLRFENLEADFEVLRKLYNIQNVLPKMNQGKKEELLLTSGQLERISKLYEKDFLMFNYSIN